MTGRARLRGQPLAVLLAIVGGWTGLRAMTWEAPDWHRETPLADAPAMLAASSTPESVQGDGWFDGGTPWPAGYSYPSPAYQGAAVWQGTPIPSAVLPASYAAAAAPIRIVMAGMQRGQPVVQSGSPGGDTPMLAAGHQLMWMAALARMAVPPEIAAAVGLAPVNYAGQSSPHAPAPVPLSPGLAQEKADRWSADAWLLLRKEGAQSLAAGRPVYGGSQAGAVLRYHLAPASGHRPLAYLRTSQAIGGLPQSEAAIGVGVRPVPSFPVTVAAETRAFRSNGKTSFRPAALAYTEFPPVDLPLGFRGDAYLQGGYVGGSFKTPFVDGQLRVDHGIVDADRTDLRLGAGAWGGAQKGAERFDLGPSASARLNLGGVPSRVSMDWRFRVLGDAEPKSGPAVTVVAGF